MKVYVNYNDNRWKKYKIDFKKIVSMAAGPMHSDSEVSIILTNDDEIHAINREYRNIDKPTNVLSFELGDSILLGDIYISLDTVAREAADAKISVAEHTAHMVVHGTLHLLGYDHINDKDADVMEGKEIDVLKKLGYKNPYADEDIGTKRGRGFLHGLLMAVCGAVAALGFAPFNMWYMTLIGVWGAYWLVTRKAGQGGFWHNFLYIAPFGAAYSLAMFWWMLHSIYVVPELTAQFAIWTVPGVIGLAVAGILIFSIPFIVISCMRLSPAHRTILFATTWTLILWLREWMFTGFPWNPIANIAMPSLTIANSMSLFGALGLTFVITGLIACAVELIRNRRCCETWAMLVVFWVLMIIGAVYGAHNIRVTERLSDNAGPVIRIVQPARSQSQKMSYSRADALVHAEDNVRNLVRLATLPGDADIVVFPETSYPFVILPGDDMEIARVLNRDIIMGASVYDAGKMYNSMVMASRDGKIQRVYSKSHLVPFGEYSPLGIMPSPANLARGMGPAVIDFSGLVFSPAICYEIIFSDSLVPSGVYPRAIVNITNDTWFGTTPGVYQHLDMVRRYAIESGLPIVRANYSGISAFVASDGKILSSLPVGQTGVLDGTISGAHMTPYRMVGRNGMMIIILAFACICTSLIGIRRRMCK